MSLSVAVMAHPKRRALVTKLTSRLGIDLDRVVWDEKNSRWDTGRRSLLAYDPECTHHLVIQDDALPAVDTIRATERAVELFPDVVFSLYAGRVREFNTVMDIARPTLPAWLQMRKINWGVALVFPTRHIDAMVAYGDTRTEIGNYDMRLSEWCVLNKLRVLYPYPSWVNHETTPSLVAGRSPRRKAMRSLPPTESAWRWIRQGPPVVKIPDFVRKSEMDLPILRLGH